MKVTRVELGHRSGHQSSKKGSSSNSWVAVDDMMVVCRQSSVRQQVQAINAGAGRLSLPKTSSSTFRDTLASLGQQKAASSKPEPDGPFS